MRNPFARLAKRDIARPLLRERAAALKASAARVIRRKSVDAAPAAPDAALAADPILAAIAETRRLHMERTRALNVDLPAGTRDPTPEQNAATNAFFAHLGGVLLKTVPTTAAGCAALARFAVEFLADEGWVLDEHDGNEHVRILDLIARSPMLSGEPTGRPFAPALAGMSDNALIRTYEAFAHAFDIAGLTTWAISDETGGCRLLNAELDRLGFLQNDIADELARRGTPDSFGLAGRHFDTLIHRAVADGDYAAASRFAAEAGAKGL